MSPPWDELLLVAREVVVEVASPEVALPVVSSSLLAPEVLLDA